MEWAEPPKPGFCPTASLPRDTLLLPSDGGAGLAGGRGTAVKEAPQEETESEERRLPVELAILGFLRHGVEGALCSILYDMLV